MAMFFGTEEGPGLPRQVLIVSEIQRTTLPANVQNVPKSLVGDQCNRGALTFQQRVRCNGCSVQYEINLTQ